MTRTIRAPAPTTPLQILTAYHARRIDRSEMLARLCAAADAPDWAATLDVLLPRSERAELFFVAAAVEAGATLQVDVGTAAQAALRTWRTAERERHAEARP